MYNFEREYQNKRGHTNSHFFCYEPILQQEPIYLGYPNRTSAHYYFPHPLVPKTSVQMSSTARRDAFKHKGGYQKRSESEMRSRFAEAQHLLNQTDAWHDIFGYLYSGLESLSMSNDFWKYTLYPLDRWSRSKAEKFPNIQDNSFDLENRERSLQYMYPYSYKIESNWRLRWFLQFLIFTPYIVIFVFLCLYFQDISLCKFNSGEFVERIITSSSSTITNVNNSNMTSNIVKGTKCYYIQQEECKFDFNRYRMDLFDYSQLRLCIFCVSMVPHLVLFVFMQMYSTILFNKLDPHNFDNNRFSAVEYTLQKDEVNNEMFQPSLLKAIYNFLFAFGFLGTGIAALLLDINVEMGLKDKCGYDNWGTIYPQQFSRTLPRVLLAFNVLSMAWGVVFFFSKLLRYYDVRRKELRSYKHNNEEIKKNTRNVLNQMTQKAGPEPTA